MPFANFARTAMVKAREGVFAEVITGERLQMAYIHLEQGAETSHSHANEQMGYILSGQVEITIGDEKRNCTHGDAYHVPGNVRHGFRPLGPEGVDYIEVFSPPKEENRNLRRA